MPACGVRQLSSTWHFLHSVSMQLLGRTKKDNPVVRWKLCKIDHIRCGAAAGVKEKRTLSCAHNAVRMQLQCWLQSRQLHAACRMSNLIDVRKAWPHLVTGQTCRTQPAPSKAAVVGATRYLPTSRSCSPSVTAMRRYCDVDPTINFLRFPGMLLWRNRVAPRTR
jgi:hypothetical protein